MKETGKQPSASELANGCGMALFRIGIPVAIIGGIGVMGIKAGIDERNTNAVNAIKQEAILLQEKGLLGERPIVDLRELPNFNFDGQIAGGFLFVTGKFHGETTQMMEFAWKPNDKDIQISSIPVRNVKYIVFDDPDTKPTVQFTGIKPEKLVDSPLNKSENVNDFVDAVADQIILVTISQKDWENFRPKSK